MEELCKKHKRDSQTGRFAFELTSIRGYTSDPTQLIYYTRLGMRKALDFPMKVDKVYLVDIGGKSVILYAN